MRALLMIALGLMGVGSFAELASAEVMNCARMQDTCRKNNKAVQIIAVSAPRHF